MRRQAHGVATVSGNLVEGNHLTYMGPEHSAISKTQSDDTIFDSTIFVQVAVVTIADFPNLYRTTVSKVEGSGRPWSRDNAHEPWQ